MMRILVTGASGYIGGAVAIAARRAGHTVTGLIRDPAKADPLTAAGCEILVGDLTEPASLAAPLAGVDAVVHTALGIRRDGLEADHAAVEVMLDALAVRNGSIVLTSGLGVYLGVTAAYVDEQTPLDSAGSQYPRVALEDRVLAAAGRSVRPVVFRLANVYGGGGAGTFTRMLLAAAREEGSGVYVGEEGTGFFSAVHIDDLVSAYLAALDRPAANGRYNLVGSTHAMRDVAVVMSHAVGAGGRITSIAIDDAMRRWGPLAHGMLGGPFVSAINAGIELEWSPSGPSLSSELLRGSLHQLETLAAK
jgi:nucleoside-diphosphate-sugar epimerase